MFWSDWRTKRKEEKRKKELKETADEVREFEDALIEKYNEDLQARHSAVDIDRTVFILTYWSSENLVKHSKHLTWLTIALLLTALAMIALAMQQANLWPFCLW